MALMSNGAAVTVTKRIVSLLVRTGILLSVLLYAGGIAWFYALGHSQINHQTYFSENALLPGLVYSELRQDTVQFAQRLAAELEHERANAHRKDTPHVWLQAKMRQIGLETYTQNFTLRYPLGGGRVFSGRNVYGILRAPRIGSAEAVVLSAPYRAPDSVHPPVAASVPVLLAFADHAKRQKYWSKDLIFVITEQEQLGMQAWLEAYYGTSSLAEADAQHRTQILNAGSLEARAGSIQAALNLELPVFDVDYLDIKIEGLNGQLPNLDLVNVVQRIALKEGFVSGHQQRSRRRSRLGAKSTQWQNFAHMVQQLLQLAAGVPNGNHGLFARFGVAALTIEGHRVAAGADGSGSGGQSGQRDANGAGGLLKLVEGVVRSVNNLLERMHQSFFFYLLVASDRYVSIGDYMPALAALLLSLLVRALLVWIPLFHENDPIDPTDTANEDDDIDSNSETNDEAKPSDAKKNTPNTMATLATSLAAADADCGNYHDPLAAGKLLLLAHVIGTAAAHLPALEALNRFASASGWRTEQLQLAIQTATCAGVAAVPLFCARLDERARHQLHVAVLLELATALLLVGMLNFALAFALSAVIVLPVLLVQPAMGVGQSTGRRVLSRVLCVALNPLVLAYGAMLGMTMWGFPELSVTALVHRAVAATAEAITFAVVDSMIYGNWTFNLVLQVLLPIWICLWTLTFSWSPMAPPVVVAAKSVEVPVTSSKAPAPARKSKAVK